MRDAAPSPGARTVLFLHRGGGQIRGSEEALLTLLEGLDRAAFHPVVLFSDPVLGAPLREIGVEGRLHDVPEIFLSRDERRFPLLRWARAARSLAAFARARGVDAIVCNGGGPCQLGVPVARRLRVPLVCFFHHPAPKNYHRAWLTRFAGDFAFSSHFTARHTFDQIGRAGTVVPLGIDARGRFAPAEARDRELRRALGFGDDAIVFAQIGALVEHKEHALLLEAFARVTGEMPEARLAVIGAGPEGARLREIAEERGIVAKVVFAGYVQDPAEWLRHVVDVHVLASREEGLGLVSLEASACALPAIGSDGTGVRETILPGRTGLLFPLGDAHALAECMLRLGRDPALRREMGAEGRAFVLDRFSPEAYRAAFEGVLRSALGGAKSASARSVDAAAEAVHA